MPYQSGRVKGFSGFKVFWVWSVGLRAGILKQRPASGLDLPLAPQTGARQWIKQS